MANNKIIQFKVCSTTEIPALSAKNRLIFAIDANVPSEYQQADSSLVPDYNNTYMYLDYNGKRYSLNQIESIRLKNYIDDKISSSVGNIQSSLESILYE